MPLGEGAPSHIIIFCYHCYRQLKANWAVTYAYRAHYNSGVVNAAEVSLNQVANLVMAIGTVLVLWLPPPSDQHLLKVPGIQEKNDTL
jgi:hypothetical protein